MNVIFFKVKIKIVLLLNSEILEEALACFYTLAIRTTDVLLVYGTCNHGCLCVVKKFQTEVQWKVSLGISVYLSADAMRWPFWCGVAAGITNHFSSGPLLYLAMFVFVCL